MNENSVQVEPTETQTFQEKSKYSWILYLALAGILLLLLYAILPVGKESGVLQITAQNQFGQQVVFEIPLEEEADFFSGYSPMSMIASLEGILLLLPFACAVYFIVRLVRDNFQVRLYYWKQYLGAAAISVAALLIWWILWSSGSLPAIGFWTSLLGIALLGGLGFDLYKEQKNNTAPNSA